MKITKIETIPVAIPIEAPLLHSTGVHPGRLQRTILRIHTDEGITGISGMGQQDQSAVFKMLGDRIIGEDPFNLNRIKHKVIRQIYHVNFPKYYGALEIALLDIQGKYLNLPIHKILGGKLKDKIGVTGYLFYRQKNDDNTAGGETSPSQMVEWSKALIKKYGFKSLKLKCGTYSPWHDLEVMRALHDNFPEIGLRIDPNGYWSTPTAIKICTELDKCNLEYIEDPAWGIGMSYVREKIKTPIATNMFPMKLDDIPAAINCKAVDIILSDTHYWAGLYGCINLGVICDTFKLGIGMHSGAEFGPTMAAMLHVASVIPNLLYDIDQHYHHLSDDILKDGKIKIEDGYMKVPDGPGLGVELDEEKVKKYHEYFLEKGDYYKNFTPDKDRPDWIPVNPGW